MSSENIYQVYTNNPSTSVNSADLFYIGQSPYGTGNDSAIKYSDLLSEIRTGLGQALTVVSDTNILLELGGTPQYSLLQATSITAAWNGQLGLTRGGTNASLIASEGGIVYSGSDGLGIMGGTTTPNLPLLSQDTTTPIWGQFALNLGGDLNTGGGLTLSGTANATFNIQNTTDLTFPTSGTLATTSQLPTPADLTQVSDTNITLTLGGAGTPGQGALLQATSITAGWSGELSLARGGTNANLSATPGAIVYSGASNFGLTSVGASGQLFQSAGTSEPVWTTATYPSTATSTGTILRANGTNWVASTATYPNTATSTGTILRADGTNWSATTATYPNTTTANQILYSSANSTIGEITAAANSVLITSIGNVPSLSQTLPAAVQNNITTVNGNTITSGTGTLTIGTNSNITSPTRSSYPPVLKDSSGNSFTMSAQNGAYIIYGNVYFIFIDIAWSSKGSAVSTLAVEITLPVTIASQPDRPTFSIAGISGITGTQLTAGGVNGNSFIELYNYNGTSTSNVLVSSFASSGFLQLSGFVGA